MGPPAPGAGHEGCRARRGYLSYRDRDDGKVSAALEPVDESGESGERPDYPS